MSTFYFTIPKPVDFSNYLHIAVGILDKVALSCFKMMYHIIVLKLCDNDRFFKLLNMV